MHIENIKSFAHYRDMYRSNAADTELLFNLPDYQDIFFRHFGRGTGNYWLAVYDQEMIVALAAFERSGERVLLCGLKPVEGKELVTDYGDIGYVLTEKVAEIWSTIGDYFSAHGVTILQLDFVREESSTFRYFSGLNDARVSIHKVDTAPFISLPKNWDGYISLLERRDRQELRRKMKRLANTTQFTFDGPRNDDEAVEEFFRLLRITSIAKDTFLTPAMASFFRDLIQEKSIYWKSEVYFLRIDGMYAAGLVGFSIQNKFLAYNAGFDPQYQRLSTGLLLHALVIRRCIERGCAEYDFLRGDERYKYDLGATDRFLYRIEIKAED